MKKYVSTLALSACYLLPRQQALAQADIHFSQFYETSVLRNPALTGIFSNDYKVGAYYRSQWSSISHPYTTVLGFGELRLPISRVSEDCLSIGLLFYSDKAGSIDQKITSFYPAINYSKSVNPDHNSYLSAGFTVGYNQYSFDPSKATFNNQFQPGSGYDPLNPTQENITTAKMSLLDFGAGINFNSSIGQDNSTTYVVGISGYHLTQPQFSYNNVPAITMNMRWNVNGAVGFNIGDNVITQLHTNFALQGAYIEQVTGGLISLSQSGGGDRPAYAITGGLFYRWQDAIIPVLKLKYKATAIAASYDVNVSKLKRASKMQGGYEITFSITGDWSDKNGILRKTVCPKF
jgi:type IX secretion system PorP/SprF family membrane protein